MMATMAEEEVVKLLQEIHDLQKTHIELYKSSLTNQRDAIENQKVALRRQKRSVYVSYALLLVLIAVVLFVSLR
jgi:hypothetical protein